MNTSSLDPTGGKVLNSWKEIANYMGRGVRTVQRWESLGLPVRRPRARSRSAVIALTDEIDAWMRAAPTSDRIEHRRDKAVSFETDALIHLRQEIETSRELRDQCRQLRVSHKDVRSRVQTQIKRLLASW